MTGKVPTIRAEGIIKEFGRHRVLDGVDLTVWQGEVVCILGPSGSGKSTLLRCMNWLSPPTSGKVWIRGERLGVRETPDGRVMPLPDSKLRMQRRRIGMVFQSFNLWPHKTVIENVMEGPIIVKRMPWREAEKNAIELLERVGLSEKRDVHPAKLSGGQQQRVAIARALAMEPEILFFDEPTSALDPELVGEVLAVMEDLARQHITMVVVTHEIGFAAEAADRIVLMDGGKVIEAGEPNAFLRNPKKERSRRFLDQFLSRSWSLHSMLK